MLQRFEAGDTAVAFYLGSATADQIDHEIMSNRIEPQTAVKGNGPLHRRTIGVDHLVNDVVRVVDLNGTHESKRVGIGSTIRRGRNDRLQLVLRIETVFNRQRGLRLPVNVVANLVVLGLAGGGPDVHLPLGTGWPPVSTATFPSGPKTLVSP